MLPPVPSGFTCLLIVARTPPSLVFAIARKCLETVAPTTEQRLPREIPPSQAVGIQGRDAVELSEPAGVCVTEQSPVPNAVVARPLCRVKECPGAKVLLSDMWFVAACGARKFSPPSSSNSEERTLPAVCGTSCFRCSQGQWQLFIPAFHSFSVVRLCASTSARNCAPRCASCFPCCLPLLSWALLFLPSEALQLTDIRGPGLTCFMRSSWKTMQAVRFTCLLIIGRTPPECLNFGCPVPDTSLERALWDTAQSTLLSVSQLTFDPSQ
ncbi:hypothetical protein V5799_011500 [Amblyomma americanum]|uniref:Uncharacterized protein n=1 Tax=Amblyomma americanum TaxID=6943 RepID=A0AAQ4EH38_AMBAM